MIVFAQQQDEDTTVATIVIRASTEHVLNDVEVRTRITTPVGGKIYQSAKLTEKYKIKIFLSI